jgi:hypothetical protein
VKNIKESICNGLAQSACLDKSACDFFHGACVDRSNLRVFVPGEYVLARNTRTVYVSLMVGRFGCNYVFNIFYNPVTLSVIVLFKWGTEIDIYAENIGLDILNLIEVYV